MWYLKTGSPYIYKRGKNEMKDFFKNIKKYWSFCCYSAYSQLNVEIAGMRLGWLWWILEPILFMSVYTFIFVVIFDRDMTYVMAYISSGLMLWNFFQRSVLNSASLVKRYAGLLNRVYLPKYVLVISTMILNGFKMLINFLIVMVFMVYYRIPLSFTMIQFLPILLVFIVFTFGVSVWMLHLGVYVPDVKKGSEVLLRVLFYVSGVFYSIDGKLGNGMDKILLNFNPVGRLMLEFRNVLLYGTNMSFVHVGILLLAGLVISVSAIFTVTRYEQHYVKVS